MLVTPGSERVNSPISLGSARAQPLLTLPCKLGPTQTG